MGRLVLTIDGSCDQTLSRRNGIAAPVDATRKWRAAGNRLARSGIQMVLETRDRRVSPKPFGFTTT